MMVPLTKIYKFNYEVTVDYFIWQRDIITRYGGRKG